MTRTHSVRFINPQGISFAYESGDFKFDPSIPLPVLTEDSGTENSGTLSLEMILAGIFHILAYMRDNRHIKYYKKFLLAARPKIREEMTEAAIMQCKNSKFENAKDIFLALEGLNPEDGITILNIAIMFDQWGDNLRNTGKEKEAREKDEKAGEYYERAMFFEPPIPDSYFNAAYFFLKQKDYKKAKEAFVSYSQLGTDEIKLKTAQDGIQRISAQDLDSEDFIKALEMVNSGEPGKAMDLIHNFLASHPKVWNGWFLLGWALREQNKWEEGARAFEKALDLGGEQADTLNELAICYLETGRLDECRRCLEKALKLDYENIKIISNLGFLALKEGNPREAEGFFRTVLEIAPEDEVALKALESIESGF